MSDSYDEIPYRSVPHPDTHPTHLAVLGRLFGIATPDPYRCRVLEVGCAAGGNLIPMAWYLPDVECLGIDRSERQAEDGRRTIAALGLRNVRIEAADILHVGAGLGRFDYIVAHGVFSWVPDVVRARILALCRELLAPTGIAFVSFNTLPGWRMRGALRDVLLLGCRGLSEPAARLARAREMLQTLAAAGPVTGLPATQQLQSEVRYLLAAHPSYLYHEYLAETNDPIFFRDFLAQAEAAGLQYVADAELATAFPSTLGTTAERALGAIEDQLELEQAMDFVRVRSFRKALLCRAEQRLEREIAPECLEELAYYGDVAPPAGLALTHSEPQPFTTGSGGGADIAHPLVKAAVAVVGERFPDSIAFTDLADAAADRLRAAGATLGPADRSILATELFSLFAGGALRAEPRARRVLPAAGDRPVLDSLGAWQAARGHVPTPRHQALELDAFAVALAGRLTGDSDDQAVADALVAAAAEARLSLPDARALSAADVRANSARLLALFRRHGVVAPRAAGPG